MHEEIERKFLVKSDAWRGKAEPVLFRQGYIAKGIDRVVRARVAGEIGTLTVKIKTGQITRSEYEYVIPLDDANSLLNALLPSDIIEKNRHTFEECGHIWEVDEFIGVNQGLVVAEVELKTENEHIEFPAWLGKEVSKISSYFNVQLTQKPYATWTAPEDDVSK